MLSGRGARVPGASYPGDFCEKRRQQGVADCLSEFRHSCVPLVVTIQRPTRRVRVLRRRLSGRILRAKCRGVQCRTGPRVSVSWLRGSEAKDTETRGPGVSGEALSPCVVGRKGGVVCGDVVV